MLNEVIMHYNNLVEENNDPVHDPLPLKRYMDLWDGEEFIKDLELDKGKSVLEFGVGTGRLAIKVCGLCKHFTGIDFSEKSIQRAQENLREFLNISLICADFMNYSFEDSFDIIYSSLTFMHIERKEEAIQKIAYLLSESGRFVLSVEKTQANQFIYGDRVITTYPDCPEDIKHYIESAKLQVIKQYETEFANIFVSSKKA
jgi:ubiquinone/menaquinone biosynthesis C-methylase UbiE